MFKWANIPIQRTNYYFVSWIGIKEGEDDMQPILKTENVTIQFGGQVAVDHVSCEIPEKHFKSIIGPNGAGKTTFFNLLSGELKPTEGDIFLRGESISKLSSVERARKGIGRSFQITNVFPNLTVLENVRLAVQSRAGICYQMFRYSSSYKQLIEETEKILSEVILVDKKDAIASQLSHGEKRKLEIAMLIALDSTILLLDEPTAGMSLEEVPIILDVIRNIKLAGEKTILLIEHKMDLILDLSDSIMVLFNGQLIADGSPKEIMNNEMVENAYLGGLYDDDIIKS